MVQIQVFLRVRFRNTEAEHAPGNGHCIHSPRPAWPSQRRIVGEPRYIRISECPCTRHVEAPKLAENTTLFSYDLSAAAGDIICLSFLVQY